MSKQVKHLWNEAYPNGVAWEYDGESKAVHSIFEESAASFPKMPCLEFLGKTYTYAEANEKMLQVAAGLQHMGIKKGDKIGLCLPNTPYYIFFYYAISKIGATVVNFNPLYTQEEIELQINDSGIKHMVTIDVAMVFEKVAASIQNSTLEKVIYCSLAKTLPSLKSVLYKIFKSSESANIPSAANFISFEEICTHGTNVTPVPLNPMTDIAVYQYTGGTTGIPKAALLTHRNVTSNAEQVTRWLKTTGKCNHERFLAALPFFHVFAMTAVLNMAMKTGSQIVMLPRFDLIQVLKTIQKLKISIFPAVPTILNALNNYKNIKKYDITSLEFCISGGATLPKQVKAQFEKISGSIVVEGYGLSETSPVTNCNPPSTGGKIGSIGLPLPGTEIQIRGLDNIDIVEGVGTRGELCIRGPQVMSGYHNRPDEDKNVFTADGFLRTGDVGYIDEDGYVFLTDRLKEIIISNGYNIYPRIIEEAFYKHTHVEEVIVIGVPDEKHGETPKAFVKLKEGAHVTEKELLEFVTSNLNPLEKPREVEIRKELPKTLIGKLSKKELIQEEAEKRRS